MSPSPVSPSRVSPWAATLRAVAAAGVLAAGILALPHLEIQASPQAAFPEVTVDLSLPESGDPTEIGRRYLAPVEAAIRTVGGVRGMSGEITPNGAWLRIRFAPGTDAGQKAARLSPLLAELAARLPGWPALGARAGSAAGGDLAALVALPGAASEAEALAAAEAFRATPGLRRVDLLGGRREEIRLRVHPTAEAAAPALERTLAGALRGEPLGEAAGAGRRFPVGVDPLLPSAGAGPVAPAALAALVVPHEGAALPLAAVAAVERAEIPRERQIHVGGRPARTLALWREREASPWAVGRAIRRQLAELPPALAPRLLRDEAAPLDRLLGRLGVGLLAAWLLGFAAAGWSAGRRAALAAGPLALAGALAACRAAHLPLDLTTLPAVALAAGTALVAVLLDRRGITARATALAAVALLPLAAAVAGDLLSPVTTGILRTFAWAAAAALLAVLLLPAGPRERAGARRISISRTLLRRALRDPATVALAAGSTTFLLLVLAGATLLPVEGRFAPETGDLTLQLSLPPGGTLAAAEALAGPIERALAGAPAVVSHWSEIAADRVRFELTLRPERRSPARRQETAEELRTVLPRGAALRIEDGAGEPFGRPLTLSARLEDEPQADLDAKTYRFLLRARDLVALRQGYERLARALRSAGIPGWTLKSDLPTPAVTIELRPRADLPAAQTAAVAAALSRASRPPAGLPLPGPADRRLVVLAPGAPSEPDQAPARADLLDRPRRTAAGIVVPAALFRREERLVARQVQRQGGAFVLPVTADLSRLKERGLEVETARIDRLLAAVPLPVGCALERPELGFLAIHREALRRTALAALLPLLACAVAAVRLRRLPWLPRLRALAAVLAPLLLAVAVAAGVLWILGGKDEEVTLGLLAVSLVAALPAGLAVAGVVGGRGGVPPATAAYRRWADLLPGLGAAGLVWVVLLGLPTLGVERGRASWALPMRAAAGAGGAGFLGAGLLVPALLPLRRRRAERAAGPAAAAVGPVHLAVRNVSKIYSNGHRGLARVSFELGPGIVGLLGPNGAGKTTLIRCLVGLLSPSRGQVLFAGRPLSPESLGAYRRRIGFLPQDFNAYPGLSGEAFLDYWASARELPGGAGRRAEIERLLAEVGLAEHGRRKVRDYSGGMRRRLGIAAALLGSPQILIVDEPTTGLDIESRSRFRDTLLAAAGERIVLLSTHIASDVEAIAPRILLLAGGRLAFDGPPETLIARARGRVFEALLQDADLAPFSHRHQVTSRVRQLAGIRVRAVAKPGQDLDGPAVEPSLEEAYLAALQSE